MKGGINTKRINIARIVWVFSIFAILIVILIMISDYKIHYQYQTIKQLHFYEYSGKLSVSEVQDDEHLEYSSYECKYEECPDFRAEIGDSYALLVDNKTNILYDYKNGKVISTKYNDYKLLNNNLFIITKNKKQGIIDLDNKVRIPPDYEELGIYKDNILVGYNLNYIIAKKDNKYGIISLKDGSVKEEIIHSSNEVDTLIKILNSQLAD